MRRPDIDSFGVAGGGLVLWDRGAARLLLYNPSAAFISHGLAGGMGREELVQAFGRQFSVSRKTSAMDVERVQAHFVSEGLLGGSRNSKATKRPADTPLDTAARAGRQHIIEIGLCGRTIRVCL